MMSSLHGIRALTNSLGDTLGENTAQLSETEQQSRGRKGLPQCLLYRKYLQKNIYIYISDLYGIQDTRQLPVEVCTKVNLLVCQLKHVVLYFPKQRFRKVQHNMFSASSAHTNSILFIYLLLIFL